MDTDTIRTCLELCLNIRDCVNVLASDDSPSRFHLKLLARQNVLSSLTSLRLHLVSEFRTTHIFETPKPKSYAKRKHYRKNKARKA